MCQATRLRLAAFLAASLALEGIVLRRNRFNSAHDGLVVMVIRLGVAALVWIERILSGGLATKTFLLAGSAIGALISWIDDRNWVATLILGAVFIRASWELLLGIYDSRNGNSKR